MFSVSIQIRILINRLSSYAFCVCGGGGREGGELRVSESDSKCLRVSRVSENVSE